MARSSRDAGSAEFVARGMQSLENARHTEDYVDADAIVEGLQRKLDAERPPSLPNGGEPSDPPEPGGAGGISSDRLAPAGRFPSEPGRNDKGEAIIWIDYEASIAIHRLRAAPAAERRPARLASAAHDDKRISLGCVVVPVEFYKSVVSPSLGRGRGVVYVLPESRPARALFDAAMVAGAAAD